MHFFKLYFDYPLVLFRKKFFLRKVKSASLIRLSGLSVGLRTKGSPVWFPVGAHAWVVGQVSSRGLATTHWCFSPFLSPSLPLSKNKINQIFKKGKRKGQMKLRNREKTNMKIANTKCYMCRKSKNSKSKVIVLLDLLAFPLSTSVKKFIFEEKYL